MEQRRTRIAGLHADNTRPAVGEEVRISGYLQWYDDKAKRWEPLRAWVKIYVDGFEVGRTATKPDGSFEFRYSSSITGKRKIEVRFVGDIRYKPCKKEIGIEVITLEQRRRIELLMKIAFALISALIIIVLLATIMFWRR